MVGQNNWFKRLYTWVVHWAHTPYAGVALFGIAVAESAFFPIPPDALLIPISVARPQKGIFYAGLCTLGSVLGGILGYFIGWQFMTTLGQKIIQIYGLTAKYYYIQHLYQTYDVWAIGLAGFTPLPYKLFTISAGAFKINFLSFVVTSILARGARFFLVGGTLYVLGEQIQRFIERYFNWLATSFAIMLVVGYLCVKCFF
ncbi:MAG: DedA family protein [Candidatus Desulfofervidaceae bacterium]|nr:DedA family protein [Candidatus Desulfofervidaceae bacterium]